MPIPAEPDMPSSVGPFRIVRVLGRGAMGVVYHDERTEQFQQDVAIKMLHPHVSLLMSEQSLQREEKVLTSLDHETIVRLLDTGERRDGTRYIVMEYVDGLRLDVFCRESGLTEKARIQLLLKIARGLDYAHRRLVIHADLKPENILVTPDGLPKILDFGVAVLVDAQAPGGFSERYTPAYASPEQMANGRVTAATDVYSLGLIAKVLLGENAGEPARWSTDLRAILSKATRAEQEKRYATMKEFADDFEAFAEYRPVAARNGNAVYRFGRWMHQHRATAATLGVLGLVLIASVTGVVVQTARAAHQRRVTQARLYDLVRLTGTLEGELYDSAHSLAHGDVASASLLQAATASLDKLSADHGADPSLALEMARQYGALARLQRTQSGSDASVRHDVEKRVALLQSIPTGDRNYPAALAEIHKVDGR